MVDFSKLGPLTNRTCSRCGQDFRGQADREPICPECDYYRSHPTEAPGYWTWERDGRGQWNIRAYWKEREPSPEPGDTVTVHRRNGSSSRETLHEQLDERFDRSGRRIIRWSIRSG